MKKVELEILRKRIIGNNYKFVNKSPDYVNVMTIEYLSRLSEILIMKYNTIGALEYDIECFEKEMEKK